MSLLELISGVDAEAAELGHAIVWDTMRKRRASGRCSGCGRDVVAATTEDHRRESEGRALRETCTRDLVMRKPSLRRRPASAPEKRPLAAFAESRS